MNQVLEKTWGEANPMRGRNYREQARQFLKDFPIGATLTNETFDQWAHHHGYLNVPFDVPKQSDVWLAHITRRNQLRTNLFKASTHVSMVEEGSECFVISISGGGAMVVESPQVALQQTAFAQKLETLIGTKRKQLGYLMQSIDFTKLPAHQKALAENLYDELSDWNSVVQLQTLNFDRRMSKLIRQIRHDVDSGLVVPANHAINNLLANKDEELPDFLTE